MPMGRLAENFARFVHPNRVENEQPPPTIATLEYSIRFEDAAFVDELKTSLRMIVKERNDLIHKKLIEFDSDSAENCRKLAKELEDQHQRIKSRFKELAAIWTAASEQIKELKEYCDSDQFENDWKVARDGLKETNH